VTVVCGNLFAQKKIVVATDASWPPMESLSSEKHIVGVDIDIMNAIAKAQRLDIEYRNVSWEAIFSTLQDGQADAIISGVTILDSRTKTMDFSIPYLSMPQVIVVQKKATGIVSMKDLHAKRIGLLKGSRSDRWFQDTATSSKWIAVEYESTDPMFYNLIAGKVDALIIDKVLAESWVKNPEDSNKIKIAGRTDLVENYGIVVKKGNQRLLKAINDGITVIRNSGLLNTLTKTIMQ